MPAYEINNFRTYRITGDGEREELANFAATIVKEVRIMDGLNTETILTISGKMKDRSNPDPEAKPITLPDVEIQADKWTGLQWVMQAWGVRCIIQPGSSVKADLCTAIQLGSNPAVSTIYKQIGWTDLGKGKRGYLHVGGAITKNGNDPSVNVRLPYELRLYDLANETDPGQAFQASLGLATLGPAEICWPLWAATYAPLFGSCDYAIHLTGRTGSFKSEICSLFQSHYGAAMDARHLPGSWSSTANALEAQSFYAQNALFVIDDFVPTGTSWQQRAYQTTADKIIRSQGNQAGRARLTDTSSLQSAYYPRGLILSTGEDTPEGHSVRARMLILETSPGDVTPQKLTMAQAERGKYSAAVADLITSLAAEPVDLTPRANEIRNKVIEIGHTRTPPMLGRLIATTEAVLDWAAGKGYLSKQMAAREKKRAAAAIIEAGSKQQSYLESADPVEMFCQAFRQVLGAGQGHVRSMNGGVPLAPDTLGWSQEQSKGDMPTWKSHGPCIGWINWNDDELFIEANSGFALIKRVAGSELALSKQTLFRRMKDAGQLTRTDDARQRNTVRVTAEGHPRQVLAMAASSTLETQEKPDDETNIGDLNRDPGPGEPGGAIDREPGVEPFGE